MKKYARLLSLVLAIMMVMAIFAACSNEDKPAETTTGTTTAATTTATTPASTEDPFDLSKTDSWDDAKWLEYEKSLDFGGATFTLGTHQRARRWPNEENPTEIDTKLAELIKGVEDDLNINIALLEKWYSSEDYATMLVAGDNDCDIYDSRPANWIQFAAQGSVFDWASAEAKGYGINVNNEKLFFQSWTHAFDINGHTYAVRYASEYYPPEAGWIMLYNEDILAANGYTNIEDMVRNNTWNWDTFLQMAKDCVKDIDGDGLYDTWGISTGYAGYGEEVVAGGGKIADWDDNGTKLVCKLQDPASIAGLDFIYQMAHSGAVMPAVQGEMGNIGYGEGHTAFAQGEVAFLYTELRIIANKAYSDEFHMRQMEDTWGVLPVPVKAGEPYRDIIGNHDTDMMLMSNKNREFSAKVYAAFARRQNDVNWKECVAECYLQDPTDTNKADILANYVIPNHVANWQWITSEMNDQYRTLCVFPLFDENKTAAQVAEEATPKLQGILDGVPEFQK